jgi:hypothetical protein
MQNAAGNSIISQPVPEIIDPVFDKTSPKRSFSMTDYERFGLVFTKTRVYKFVHWTTVTARKRQAVYGPFITYKITPAGSLFSSQPGGPPCWVSPLAFGLLGDIYRSSELLQ